MWTYRKQKRKYIGSYSIKFGERVFILTAVEKRESNNQVVFESWQMAKKLGWSRK